MGALEQQSLRPCSAILLRKANGKIEQYIVLSVQRKRTIEDNAPLKVTAVRRDQWGGSERPEFYGKAKQVDGQ